MEYKIKVGDYVEDKKGRIGYVTNVYPWGGFSYMLKENINDNTKTIVNILDLNNVENEFVRIGQNDFLNRKYSYSISLSLESNSLVNINLLKDFIKCGISEYSRLLKDVKIQNFNVKENF